MCWMDSLARSSRRGLHQRHIQMIALAGTIGTGLFLGSGKAIARGGPLGALQVIWSTLIVVY
jgi:amino acid permease